MFKEQVMKLYERENTTKIQVH